MRAVGAKLLSITAIIALLTSSYLPLITSIDYNKIFAEETETQSASEETSSPESAPQSENESEIGDREGTITNEAVATGPDDEKQDTTEINIDENKKVKVSEEDLDKAAEDKVIEIISKPEKAKQQGEYAIYESISIGEEYRAVEDEGTNIIFNKLPQGSFDLKIEKVSLGNDIEGEALLTPAYEFTTVPELEKGSFEAVITLPLNEKQDESNEVAIKYSEDGINFGTEQVGKTKVDQEQVKFSVDHFTIFVIVNPLPSGATEGDACTVGALIGEECYTTIQAALDQAALTPETDTITVTDGVYAESLTINSDVVLTAENTHSAVLDGSSLTGSPVSIRVHSGNVTISGFEIMNYGEGITVGYEPGGPGNLQGITITDNILHDFTGAPHGFGIYAGYESEGFGVGTLSEQLDYTGLVISGNEIYNTANAGVVLQSLETTSGNITVSGNNVYSAGASGMWLDSIENVSVTDNNFNNNAGAGIFISAGADGWYEGTGNTEFDTRDVSISANSINSNNSGITIYDGHPDLITAQNNTISGNTTGIENNLDSSYGIVDARFNEWGSVDGPNDPTSGDGSLPETNASSANAANGAVDYRFWNGSTQPTGFIQGRTFIDLNDNGIQVDGDVNSDGFTVRLYDDSWNSISDGNSNSQLTTSSTGGTGQFRFEDLPAADDTYYVCSVDRSGFAQSPAAIGQLPVTPSGAAIPGSFADAEVVANSSGAGDESGNCWQVTLDDNDAGYIKFGYVEFPTPTNEGWNLRTESTDPFERPADLACGSITNGDIDTFGDARAAHQVNYTGVTTLGGNDVEIVRRVTFPNGTTTNLYYGYMSNTAEEYYTDYLAFGNPTGINGTWGIEVGAFVDENGNGTYEDGEQFSGWSDNCAITLDTETPAAVEWQTPTAPSFFTRLADFGPGRVDMVFAESTDANLDYYQYQFRSADLDGTNASSNLVNMNTSSGGVTCAAGECTWSPVFNDGRMNIHRVRAVDAAGNVGPWSNWDGVDAATFATLDPADFQYEDYLNGTGVFDPATTYVDGNGGFAIREQVAPTSAITGPMSVYETSNVNVDIDFEASDEDTAVKNVQLYMAFSNDGGTTFSAYNQVATIDYPALQQQAVTGSFDFDLPNGAGTYCFYTVAEDIADDLTLDNNTGNLEAAKDCQLEVLFDDTAPEVSVGIGNNGADGTRENSAGMPEPIVNLPDNASGQTHRQTVNGTIDIHATATDPESGVLRYHFRIFEDGTTEEVTPGTYKPATPNGFRGGDAAGEYVYTEVTLGDAANNTAVLTLDTTTLEDGDYWLAIGARNNVNVRNAGTRDTDPRILITVDNYGHIQGRKYHDVNSNGVFDNVERNEAGDPNRLNGWEINLYDDVSMTTPIQTLTTPSTGQKGQFRFEDLLFGTYYVCETPQAGWMQTSPSDPSGPNNGITDDYILDNYTDVVSIADPNNAGQFCYQLDLAPGEEKEGIRFGNEFRPEQPVFWVEEDTNAIKIDWEEVNTADFYRLYRNGAVVADNLTDNTYTDTITGAHVYELRAVSELNGTEKESEALDSNQLMFAETLDIVIDDDAVNTDWNDEAGTDGTTSFTGPWTSYGRPGTTADITTFENIVNATGGDLYGTPTGQPGLTFTWETTENMELATYEVYVNYMCNSPRPIGTYEIYSGMTMLGSVDLDQATGSINGTPCDQFAENTETGWISLGQYDFSDLANASVRLVAPETGRVTADAVGFRYIAPLGEPTLDISDLTINEADLPTVTATCDDTNAPGECGNLTWELRFPGGSWNTIATGIGTTIDFNDYESVVQNYNLSDGLYGSKTSNYFVDDPVYPQIRVSFVNYPDSSDTATTFVNNVLPTVSLTASDGENTVSNTTGGSAPVLNVTAGETVTFSGEFTDPAGNFDAGPGWQARMNYGFGFFAGTVNQTGDTTYEVDLNSRTFVNGTYNTFLRVCEEGNLYGFCTTAPITLVVTGGTSTTTDPGGNPLPGSVGNPIDGETGAVLGVGDSADFTIGLPEEFNVQPEEVNTYLLSISGESFENLTCTWDFGDGTVISVEGDENNGQIDHDYDDPGTYTMTVTCEDADGGITETTSTVRVGEEAAREGAEDDSSVLQAQDEDNGEENGDEDGTSIIETIRDNWIVICGIPLLLLLLLGLILFLRRRGEDR